MVCMMKIVLGTLLSMSLLLYLHTQRILQPREANPYQFSEQQVQDYHAATVCDIDYYTEQFDHSFFAQNSAVLDVGCRDGRITSLIAQRHPDCTVLGVDASHEMIKFALRCYGRANSNLSFAEKYARNLGFTEAFDRVVSFYCLHWISDQETALRSMYCSLKPGGEAFIIVTPVAPQDHFQSCCRSVILSFKWLPYFLTFRSSHSMHTEEQYRRLLLACGFTIKSIVPQESYIELKDREETVRFLRAVLTPLSHLAESNRQGFIDDFLKELARQNGIDECGVTRIRVTQLEMWVVKP